ncbi:MAG: type II secretion system protein GspG [Acidobacteriota bacterium]
MKKVFVPLVLITAFYVSTAGRPSPRWHPVPPRQKLWNAIGLFALDLGRYPTTEEGLWALRVNRGIKSWAGPYISCASDFAGFTYRNEGEPILEESR